MYTYVYIRLYVYIMMDDNIFWALAPETIVRVLAPTNAYWVLAPRHTFWVLATIPGAAAQRANRGGLCR